MTRPAHLPMLPTLPSLALAAVLVLAGPARAQAQELPPLSRGQTLYLPVYSHLWHGNRDKQGRPEIVYLSALVSIRNTDPTRPLRVTQARYYDTAGKSLRDFVSQPQTVPPLGTLELFIERREAEGGSGANFLIRWQADGAINPPLVEAVHTDLYGNRAISFSTQGRPINAGE